MRRPRRPAQDLRLTIDCLPHRTRSAMLDGIDSTAIIVGAYTDGDGGICPMLAAHRAGGRTDLASFARAWDRYTGAGGDARRATERELLALRSMLHASLAGEVSMRGELGAAVAEHRAAKGRREVDSTPDERARPDMGERDRTRELRHRPGWSWLRVFRRYDDYRAALEQAGEAERASTERELEPA